MGFLEGVYPHCRKYPLLPISHTLAKDRKDDGFRRNYVMFLEGKSVPDEIELNLLDGANEIRQRS